MRAVEYKLDDPVYVVAFKPGGFYWSWKNVIQRVAAGIDAAHVFIVVRSGEYRKLANRVISKGRRIL